MNSPLLFSWLFGTLVGSMLFFATTLAPRVFRALPAAGTFLRRLYPLYYRWGLALSILCTIAAYLGANLTAASLCARVTSMFGYAQLELRPLINRARERKLDGDPAPAKRTDRRPATGTTSRPRPCSRLIGRSLL